MASLNKVCLLGNLGRDPEVRSTQAGVKIANLNLATSESWKDRNTGERREKTEWHRVVIFAEPLVKLAENFLRKGSRLYLEGKLQTRKWTDQAGQEKYSTEVVLEQFNSRIVLLDQRRDDERGGEREERDPAQPGAAYGAPRGDLDDEIPF